MKNITNIDLSFNQISKIEKTALKELKNLECLNLSDNKLENLSFL